MIHVSFFFAAITSAFAAMTLTTSSGSSRSVVGSTSLSPITSRVSAGPAGSGGFVISMAAPDSNSTTGSFGFGSGWSRRTGLKNPFWGALNQNSLGAAGQSTPTPIHVASTPQDTSGIAAITSAFAAMTLTTSSGTSSSVFGSTTLSPVMSRVSAGPAGSGGFVVGMVPPHRSSTTGSFVFGSERSGRTGLKNPFWGALKPSSLGAAGQSTPTPFHVASTPQNTSGFAAITSDFGAVTQTTSSGTSNSVFGSTTSSPFTSVVSVGPSHSGGFGMSVAAPHSSSTTGAFGFGEDRVGALVA
ncbi:putative nuclear envelope pore membrane protein POM 121B [Manis pentadactyla]|uniref:putative nuclear envelope pore membrane protein POM 121B n=1 Tax=Manis pentadactyla TaxID=143292 RepID=UPI00255C3C6C|nr:putative nuclear envelope pore membrane protein POM 121B [Manis pentadactyla]XP_057342553.1 putative nuclear envelope pore membrane protein POM 121B [Manis pentadactyla]